MISFLGFGGFLLIVFRPPYLKKEVVEYEEVGEEDVV